MSTATSEHVGGRDPGLVSVSMPDQGASGTSESVDASATSSQLNEDAEENLRREALRKKGAEFLSKALEASGKGEDPFSVAPAEPVGKSKLTNKRTPKVDPDVVAFGRFLQEAKLYVFMAVYVLTSAASPVLVKRSFVSMQTPAVLTFLHMIAVVLALWIANHFDSFKLDLSGMTLRGAAVRSTLTSLQMLCTFSALHHNSVNLVMVWTYVGAVVIDIGMPFLVKKVHIPADIRQIMIAAVSAGVLEIVLDRDKVPVGFLMMGLWMALRVAEWGWKQLKADSSAGGNISDIFMSTRIHQLSDEEDAVDAQTMVFFQNALPAVPILLLGFIAQEGKELVDHELSVPAVRTMLMACLCYTLSTLSFVVLTNRINSDMKLIIRTTAVSGTIIFFCMDEIKTISLFAVLLTAVAVGAAQACQWMHHAASGNAMPV